MKKYDRYTFSEARTGLGQIISFSCHPDSVSVIKAFVEDKVRHIDMPVTHKANVAHGGYSRYTRYLIHQHKYAGGQCEDSGHGGFVEAIEIKEAPDGRNPFIIYSYQTLGASYFSEWDSLENAIKAWEECLSKSEPRAAMPAFPGFKRIVECGVLNPWFYAVGEECLVGDYALCSGLEDDPVFRLGRKFVVAEDKGISRVKTCMGSRYYEEKVDDGRYNVTTHRYRKVYFHDGTTVRILEDDKIERYSGRFFISERVGMPRPLEDREAWVVEAQEKFAALLAGMKEGFQIKFADGSTFTGKLSRKGKKMPSVAGDYNVRVTYEKGDKQEGWVKDFIPTAQHPDIVCLIEAKKRNEGKIVSKVEILECKQKSNGKKWSGVFFSKNI